MKTPSIGGGGSGGSAADTRTITGYYLDSNGTDTALATTATVAYGTAAATAKAGLTTAGFAKLSDASYVAITIAWAFNAAYVGTAAGAKAVTGTVSGTFAGGQTPVNQTGTVTVAAAPTAADVDATNNLAEGTKTLAVTTAEGYFTFDSNTKTITAYNIAGGTNVVIPETIGGVAVTSIGNTVFNGKQITNVTIPNSVTTIGNWAFSQNYSLTSVTIPNSVTGIGERVFSHNQLASVILPNSVTSLGVGAFDSNNLISITIGPGVTIGNYLLDYEHWTNKFREAYQAAGFAAGTYTGTQTEEWTKVID